MREIGVFVDVSNLYYCISRKYDNRKLSYKKYMDFIKELGHVVSATAYGSQMNREAHKFVAALRGIGFATKFKSPKEYKNKKRKSDWDVGIAVDMIESISSIDTIVLGSADCDMSPAVDYAMDRSVKVIVLACGISSELHIAAHESIEIPESMLEVL